MKKPKTDGLVWLNHSLVAFNGSGYADMNNAGAYLDSYRDYNLWKKRMHAVVLLDQYWHDALMTAHELVTTSLGSGHVPNQKNWTDFNNFRQGR